MTGCERSLAPRSAARGQFVHPDPGHAAATMLWPGVRGDTERVSPRALVWVVGVLSLVFLMSACQRGQTPHTGPEFVARGEQRLQAHDLEGALADFTQAVRFGQEDAAGARARVLLDLGRYEQAREDLDRMVALRPNESVWYRLRARDHLELGQFSQAVSDAGQAIRLEPNDQKARVIRARAWQAQDRLEDALKDLDAAVNLGADAETYLLRGDVRVVSGDLDGARADYEQAKGAGEEAGALRGLAKVSIAEGKYEAAVKLADRAARLEPTDPENHAVDARALELAGRQSDARKAWDRGAESVPDAVCIRAGRAPFALLTGDAHVAREDLNTLLQLHKRVSTTLVWLLLVDLDQGATREEVARSARAFLERAGADSRVAPVFRFLAGDIDAKQMVEAVPAGWQRPSAWRSFASFVAGYAAYHVGDRATAKRWLERTVAAQRRLSDEFFAARYLLEQLSRP